MSTNSKIEWTNHTWNPVTGCTKVSQGCKFCYAEKFYERFNGPGSFKNVTCHPDRLHIPVKWKNPALVFLDSMSDLFHESVPFSFIDQVFAIMALTPQHTYQVVTKRAKRMLEYFQNRGEDFWEIRQEAEILVMEKPHLYHVCERLKGEARKLCGNITITNELLPHLKAAGWFYDTTYNEFGKEIDLEFEGNWPLKNVWLMVSVEDQAAADERIPLLLQCPAVVRGLSCEPLLGPVDLVTGQSFSFRNLIHWVIVGGESGSPRPMHPDHVRTIQQDCLAAGVPFFFKQWGNWLPVGQEESAMPNLLTTEAKKKEIDGHQYYRLPKAIAGRRLDGKEYNGFPNTNKH